MAFATKRSFGKVRAFTNKILMPILFVGAMAGTQSCKNSNPISPPKKITCTTDGKIHFKREVLVGPDEYMHNTINVRDTLGTGNVLKIWTEENGGRNFEFRIVQIGKNGNGWARINVYENNVDGRTNVFSGMVSEGATIGFSVQVKDGEEKIEIIMIGMVDGKGIFRIIWTPVEALFRKIEEVTVYNGEEYSIKTNQGEIVLKYGLGHDLIEAFRRWKCENPDGSIRDSIEYISRNVNPILTGKVLTVRGSDTSDAYIRLGYRTPIFQTPNGKKFVEVNSISPDSSSFNPFVLFFVYGR